jgi:hypothetical protein
MQAMLHMRQHRLHAFADSLQCMLALQPIQMLTHATWVDNYLCREISDKKGVAS